MLHVEQHAIEREKLSTKSYNYTEKLQYDSDRYTDEFQSLSNEYNRLSKDLEAQKIANRKNEKRFNKEFRAIERRGGENVARIQAKIQDTRA